MQVNQIAVQSHLRSEFDVDKKWNVWSDSQSSFTSSVATLIEMLPLYQITSIDIGAVLVPSRHQVSEVVEGELDGIVLSQSKRGIVDKDGEVLR